MSHNTDADPYADLGSIGEPGENLLTIGEDGSLTLTRKLPEERPALKGAHTAAIEKAGDEMIERVTETGLGVYYRLGNKITVRGGSGDHWLCLTCSGQDRYELGDHKGCVHIQRVKRWAADHPTQPLQAAS